MDAWIAVQLSRFRYPLLLMGCALAACAFTLTEPLEFDQSVESMFSDDDPVLLAYQKLQRTYGGNKLVLAVYEDTGLLAPDGAGVERSKVISAALGEVEGVLATFALHDPMGTVIVDPKNPLGQKTLALFEGTTHSADGMLAAVACMLDPEVSLHRHAQAVQDLRAVMRQLPAPLTSGHITGEPVIVADGFRMISRDGRQLAIASAILLGATIAVCFRKLRWMLVPIVIVQVVLLLTKALISWAGLRMTMISSVLTSVTMVIAVATLVHFMVRYEWLRKAGYSADVCLRATIRSLAAPVFFALLTDAVGFAALIIAKVGPVHDYGIMMSVATLMILVVVPLLLPGLATMGSRRDEIRSVTGSASDETPAWHIDNLFLLPANDVTPSRWEAAVGRLAAWSISHPRAVAISVAALAAVSCAGLPHLEVETDFTKNFRRDSSIVQGYELVESRLGGAGVCEIMLPMDGPLDREFLQRAQVLQQELRDRLIPDAGVTKVMSIADGLTMAAGPVLDSLPKALQQTALQTAVTVLKAKMPTFFGSMVGVDPVDNQGYFRVMIRALERQPAADKKTLIADIGSIARAHFPEAEVTGFYVLLSNLIDSVLRDQRRSFALAIVAMIVVMSIAFRSLRLAILGLVPNLLPIMVVAGAMGWLRFFGWPFKTNLGVALIAAVSLGLSVDCTIHYIIALQRCIKAGLQRDETIVQVNRTVARAMIISTLALVVGFAVMCGSQFIPTVYFGALVSLAMLGGLIGNLVILPAVCARIFADTSTLSRRQQSTNRHSRTGGNLSPSSGFPPRE